MDHIIWGGSEKLGDDGELVDVVLPGEEGLALQHLRKDAPGTPDVNLHIILLPCEHDLRRSIVSCRDVSRHLRILDSGQAEVADLEIAVFVDEDVAGLEITMNDPCRVDIFQPALHVDGSAMPDHRESPGGDLPGSDRESIG